MAQANAAIIIVGDEILAGHTLDTNSRYVSQRLRSHGIAVQRIEKIPDDVGEIEATLRRILVRDAPTFLFVVGGIGPTPDDRTYEGVRRALGVEFEIRPEHARAARERAERYGYADEAWADVDKSEAVRRMIRLPAGSEALENPVGAALGCVARTGASHVVVLPGVPKELVGMFELIFEPRYLSDYAPDLETRELEVWGAEAALWDSLTEVEKRYPKVRLGSYPQDDRGRIILRLHGPKEDVGAAATDLAKRTTAYRKGPKAS